ncbi:phosphatase PAP2 family protein [Streptosporangium carneum]|uniref:Phosphatase PAP2 family protein n=1 Tax=Streptosporangium carneum TaxID=47481 RepID=A0A9W6MDW2_9ACTN|nr:phosphatase PAP2 family protein [Streptosporangium carneum]GLK10571.1 phosphatase PAP2 family protein [Streptosporangium carneum]
MDGGLYRDIVEIAASTPEWVRGLVGVGTDGVLAVFAALFLGAWWRARRGRASGMALALLAPVAMVASYAVSEVVKELLREDRPCRLLTEVATIVPCPPYGDWSLPSNHAALVAAAAAGLVLAWPASTPYVIVLALLGGMSRVFVGVHYPHDVAAGLLLGGALAPMVSLALNRPTTALVERLRGLPVLRPLLLAPAAPERERLTLAAPDRRRGR